MRVIENQTMRADLTRKRVARNKLQQKDYEEQYQSY
jgi:hypothetical protein